MTFAELGLSPETLRAVEDSGYTTPTPIQEQAIPWVLMGRDVLGIAQTGTGKTASFTLPMIDILASGRAKARMPRSLILAPTRELANQVAENFTKYGKYQKLNMALLIGGESFTEQNKVLERGVDVLIATPGRLMDMFDRGKILLRDVKILVIDEADRMLDMGFIPDVERIVSLLPPLRQTLFFSATMDKAIRKLADAFLHNPKEVKIDAGTSAAATVTQQMVVVDHMDKREALRHILRMEDVRNAFIFCNRKRDVGVLYKSLTKHGFDVAQLHGDMPQSERTATLARFKAGEVKLMVCSDVAARGIDIADVSHVFNFDVPIHSEDYVHRIGRTGRAGREGRAYTIASPDDARYVATIEALIGKEIPRIVLEGIETRDLAEGEGSGGRERRNSGRDKRRGRDRDRGRERGPRRDQGERAAAETPVETVAEAPVAEALPASPADSAEAPRGRDRERSRDRDDRRRDRGERERERSERDRGGERDRGERQRRGRRFDPAWTEVDEMRHGDDVLAFGDHAPAFLFAPTTGTEARAQEEAARASRGEAPPEEKKTRRRRSRTADGEAVTETSVDAEVQETEAQETEVQETGVQETGVQEAEVQEAGGVEVEPPEAAPPVAQPAAEEKPKRTRTARPRKKAAEAPVEDNATEPAQAEMPELPQAEPSGEAAESAAEEKPKRKRTPRAKKAAEEPLVGAAEPAAEEKPKRRRAPRKGDAAAVEAEGAGEGAAGTDAEAAPVEEKPKRKRAPRVKKAAETAAEEPVPTPATEPASADEGSEG